MVIPSKGRGSYSPVTHIIRANLHVIYLLFCELLTPVLVCHLSLQLIAGRSCHFLHGNVSRVIDLNKILKLKFS